eukprot:836577-Pelagomonas_calceolata.AAC.2
MPLFPWFGSFVPQHMCSSQEAPEIPFSCRTSWGEFILRTCCCYPECVSEVKPVSILPLGSCRLDVIAHRQQFQLQVKTPWQKRQTVLRVR